MANREAVDPLAGLDTGLQHDEGSNGTGPLANRLPAMPTFRESWLFSGDRISLPQDSAAQDKATTSVTHPASLHLLMRLGFYYFKQVLIYPQGGSFLMKAWDLAREYSQDWLVRKEGYFFTGIWS